MIVVNMREQKGTLAFPFSHYWKSYSEGECPFCKSDSLVCSEHGDLFWCRGYASYVSNAVCEEYLCACKGQCDDCCKNCGPTVDYFLREEVEAEVFLCEKCRHGVNFTQMKLVNDFVEQREKATCNYCQWHSEMVGKHRK